MTPPAPADPPAPSETEVVAPRWGVGEVLAACVGTILVAAVASSIIVTVGGVEEVEGRSLAEATPLPLLALSQATLWIGMVGAIVVLVRRRGGTVGEDLGLSLRPLDVPLGVVLGIACQLVLVPAISWPWLRLQGESSEELSRPACVLADKADDSLGVVLLVLITVVGAPLVEELFFRGFAQRAMVARLGTVLGILASAVLFGLVHFQVLQLPALIAFGVVLGVLAHLSGRLGPGIVAHMAFNATTVVGLLALSGSGTCDDLLAGMGLR